MFCRNCGKELEGTPEICLGCGAKPLSGTKFCNGCGATTTDLTEICVKCGVKLRAIGNISSKSRLATSLLAYFLGMFGAHRFYTGKTGTAVVMLVLAIIGWATVWIFGIGLIFIVPVAIWGFVDFIIAVSGNAKDSQGKEIRSWQLN